MLNYKDWSPCAQLLVTYALPICLAVWYAYGFYTLASIFFAYAVFWCLLMAASRLWEAGDRFLYWWRRR